MGRTVLASLGSETTECFLYSGYSSTSHHSGDDSRRDEEEWCERRVLVWWECLLCLECLLELLSLLTVELALLLGRWLR